MATKLDLVDAQLIGFKYGKWHGDNIVPLIETMGLTKKEWKKFKTKYPTDSLSPEELNEIEEYFRTNFK